MIWLILAGTLANTVGIIVLSSAIRAHTRWLHAQSKITEMLSRQLAARTVRPVFPEQDR